MRSWLWLGARLGNELGKSGSPRLGLEATEFLDEPKPAPKGKGKTKAKKGMCACVTAGRTYSDSFGATRRLRAQCQWEEGACTTYLCCSCDLLIIGARIDQFAVGVSSQKTDQEGKDHRYIFST